MVFTREIGPLQPVSGGCARRPGAHWFAFDIADRGVVVSRYERRPRIEFLHFMNRIVAPAGSQVRKHIDAFTARCNETACPFA